MAVTKLYPPVVAGTTPPFYTTKDGTVLSVPFTMNKIVGIAEVGGVKLRIRKASNDFELGRLNASAYSEGMATFDLSPIIASLIVTNFYKIQLAYVDIYGNVGYYSTVSVVKYTAEPSLSLVGLNEYNVNRNLTHYTGHYANINDSSEKCHQYRFVLTDMANNQVYASDWMIHNSNNNVSSWESVDNFTLPYYIDSNEKFKLRYQVITNNGLRLSSSAYILTGEAGVAADSRMKLISEADYDNGCISLTVVQDITLEESQSCNGAYMISRASSKDDYRIWINVYSFSVEEDDIVPYAEQYNDKTKRTFRDFTINHGEYYKYAIQQFNSNGFYSKKVMTEPVSGMFEDSFLFDGERQLKLRFNTKMGSFKTVIQDTKKNTIGSKYPFFFRNGNIAYKEFPIGGLISYLSDENGFFLDKEKDLGMPKDWQETTDIIDDNITYERVFKTKVMDWLNDGKIKLFRSPTEGNFLVRLMNINLTPQVSLSRMLHDFSCTASEVDECTALKLEFYGFYKNSTDNVKQLRYFTINFDEVIEDLIAAQLSFNQTRASATQTQIDKALAAFCEKDLLSGCESAYLRFEDCESGLYVNIDSQQVMIGATGIYEINYERSQHVLKIPQFFKGTLSNKVHRHMPGQVTVGIWSDQPAHFAYIDDVNSYDVLTFFGAGGLYGGGNSTITYPNDFILDFYYYGNSSNKRNVKENIDSIHYAEFRLIADVYLTVTSLDALQSQYSLQLERISDKMYNIKVNTSSGVKSLREVIDSFNPENRYKDYFTCNCALIHTTNDDALYIVRDYPTARTGTTDAFLIKYGSDATQRTVNINGQNVTLQPTQVCINNDIFDLKLTGSLSYPETDAIPSRIICGLGVEGIMCYNKVTRDYSIEDSTTLIGTGNSAYSMHEKKVKLNALHAAYDARLLEYICVVDSNFYDASNPNYNYNIGFQGIIKTKYVSNMRNSAGGVYTSVAHLVQNNSNGDYDEFSFFYWNNDHFERLSRSDQASFVGDHVWMPVVWTQYGPTIHESDLPPGTDSTAHDGYNSYLEARTQYNNLLDNLLSE